MRHEDVYYFELHCTDLKQVLSVKFGIAGGTVVVCSHRIRLNLNLQRPFYQVK